MCRRLRPWGHSLILESTRLWEASKRRSFRTTRGWRRFAGDTRFARSCCVPRWLELRRIRIRLRIRTFMGGLVASWVGRLTPEAEARLVVQVEVDSDLQE